MYNNRISATALIVKLFSWIILMAPTPSFALGCFFDCLKLSSGGQVTVGKVAEGAPEGLSFNFELYGGWILPGEGGFNPFYREFSLENGEAKTFEFAAPLMVGLVTEVDIPAGWSLQNWHTDPGQVESDDPFALGLSFGWGGVTTFEEAAPNFGLLEPRVREAIVGLLSHHLPENGAVFVCKGGEACDFELIATNVPVPAAAWLFASALLGLAGVARKRSVIDPRG